MAANNRKPKSGNTGRRVTGLRGSLGDIYHLGHAMRYLVFPLLSSHARTHARQERHRSASSSSFRSIEDDLSLLTSRNIRVLSGKSLSDLPGAKQDDMQRSCAGNLKKGNFTGSRSYFTIGDAEKANVELMACSSYNITV